MPHTNAPTLRRSSRIPVTVPVLVTSMEPGAKFSEVCETTVVSAHGCAMRAPHQLKAGAPLHFHNQDGRETTAQVVSCLPIGTDRHTWMLAARFDQPENFWGLKTVPKDWMSLPMPGKAAPGNGHANHFPAISTEQVAAASARMVLEKIRKQLSDEHLQAVLAELIRPFEAEVAALRNKMGQSANKSRFEVSLSQIPPELEQQLELRLRQHLEPQVLQQAQEQSGQVLEATKQAINQKTETAHGEFVRRLTHDLEAVEQRTERLATDVGQTLREHLNRGLGELHQEVVDAGNHLKRVSADLLDMMQQRLTQEHETRSRYLEQAQAAVAEEASRLQQQITDLDLRMATLDESARRLESGLDQRLSKLASDAVRTARAQMEAALDLALNDLSTRNAEQLSTQLDEAGANLKIIQKGIEASVSESLRAQAGEMMQSFERSMQELAQLSVERWRIAFAGGLNSLVRVLGEQFVLQAANSDAAQTRSGR
jgi:hypothetical protein